MHPRTALLAQVAYTQREHVTCYGISSLISCALCALHSALPPAPRNKRAANNKQQMRFVVAIIVACGKLCCTLQCFNWKVCNFSRISSNEFPIANGMLVCLLLYSIIIVYVCVFYMCVCVFCVCMCGLRCCMQWGMKSLKPFFSLAKPNHFLPALVTDIAWMEYVYVCAGCMYVECVCVRGVCLRVSQLSSARKLFGISQTAKAESARQKQATN